jgi:hypothetical protein
MGSDTGCQQEMFSGCKPHTNRGKCFYPGCDDGALANHTEHGCPASRNTMSK